MVEYRIGWAKCIGERVVWVGSKEVGEGESAVVGRVE